MNELFAGKQVTVWFTERCEISASDAKLYADALVQLGVDRPADLQMIDGDEAAWAVRWGHSLGRAGRLRLRVLLASSSFVLALLPAAEPSPRFVSDQLIRARVKTSVKESV